MFKERKRKMQIRFLAVCMGAILITLLDMGVIGKDRSIQTVKRAPAGEGSRKETFVVRRKGGKEKRKVQVMVEEKSLTKKEARAAVKKAVKALDKEVLETTPHLITWTGI